MTSDDYFNMGFFGAIIMGSLYAFIKSDNTVQDHKDKTDNIPQELSLFDCPRCNLPAEATHLVSYIDVDNTQKFAYVVNCLNEQEDPFVVTPTQLDNLLAE